MMQFDHTYLKTTVAAIMRRNAGRREFDGRDMSVVQACTAVHVGLGVATVLVFTRDTGHHSSGWWRNPEYERCYHLSLSFRDPARVGVPGPRDVREAREWVRAFYGPHVDKVWCESPYSSEGKSADVWHYRVFADEHWSPIVPRREVYSHLAGRGWRSFTELQAEIAGAREASLERNL